MTDEGQIMKWFESIRNVSSEIKNVNNKKSQSDLNYKVEKKIFNIKDITSIKKDDLHIAKIPNLKPEAY